MAEFFTSEEEKVVDQILPKSLYYWIGLLDIGYDNSWVWQEQNETPKYTNWNNNQPNNRG